MTIEKKAVIESLKHQLVKMTSEYCKDELDIEYTELCEKMIEKMARKRQVPFVSGKIEIWAASIVYAIGSVNFLFDKSFTPYATGEDIANYFNVSKSTIGQKAKKIREMFKINYWDNEFSTKRMLKSNPLANLRMTKEGFIISI